MTQQVNEDWEKKFDEQFPPCNGGDAVYAAINDDGLSTGQHIKSFIRTLLATKDAACEERVREAVVAERGNNKKIITRSLATAFATRSNGDGTLKDFSWTDFITEATAALTPPLPDKIPHNFKGMKVDIRSSEPLPDQLTTKE